MQLFTIKGLRVGLVVIGLAMLGSCAAPLTLDDPSALLGSGRLGSQTTQTLELLIDPTASYGDRRLAATSLLDQGDRGSEMALASVLNQPEQGEATGAVVEAIALRRQAPAPALSGPMLNLLRRCEPPLQVQTAEALVRFEDPRLVARLIDMAQDDAGSLAARRGAIAALGYQGTQPAAEALIELIGTTQPATVQQAAYEALALLSGMEELDQDRAAWLKWWSAARQLDVDKWFHSINQNIRRDDTVNRVRQQEMLKELLAAMRASYRITTPQDRPGVLAYMLDHSLEAMRQLGMDLVLERLLEGLAFPEPLREAMRARLVDAVPHIRQQATLRLYDLADEQAADIVARRLSSKEESVTAVLRADLLLMARLSRSEAVEPALELLDHTSLRGEAAGTLAAAAEHGMLTPRQAASAAKRVRRQLRDDDQLPPPQVVTLLGKVGNDRDWQRIADWVDSDNGAVKEAAAQAWAESQRSLKLLADRVTDPRIQPIVIVAATLRGDDPWTLRALAQNRPQREQMIQPWRRALVAMSGRVPPDAVLGAIGQLEKQEAPDELIEQMLSAALENADQNQVAHKMRLRLLLRRAQARLALENAMTALADFGQLSNDVSALTNEQRDFFYRGSIKAHLQLNQIAPAFAVAGELLGGVHGRTITRPSDDPVIDQFIEVARQAKNGQRPDEARAILVKLRNLLEQLGQRISPEVAQRIAFLEAALTSSSAQNQPVPDQPEQATATP